jgi:UDP-N-acetylmuramyl pentapeptide phosphotransferase/UDP-N-acetylglucosamine-1-phosphate transferase
VWIVLGAGHLLLPAPILEQRDTLTWLGGASGIAVLGFVDDVRPLPALVRLLLQLTVGTVVLVVALRSDELCLAAGWRVHMATWVLVPAVLFVVGTTNIYNFMDGMDGLAAAQTISAGLALAAAAAVAGQLDVAFIALAIAAATAGFFVHNAPPATIFLGDAGSTFVGLTFATLAIIAANRPSPVPIAVVPVALAPFLLDGTFTILRRLSRGERVWRAHRSHLYQRAVATGLTHRQVLVVYAAWCAVAGAEGLLATKADATMTAPLVAAGALPLLAVWIWTVRLEANADRSHPSK